MAGVVARQLKQHSAFTSGEQEVLLGLLIAAARSVEPWEKFLKATAGLTNNQYNVLRILRGSHPSRLACSEIADRMIARDPDVTRLIDRLSRRGLVARIRTHLDQIAEAKAWAFLLHDVCGYDLREAAEIMNVSVAAAQQRLVRGRRELRELIGADPELANWIAEVGP